MGTRPASPTLVTCVHHWFSAKVENLQPGMQGARLGSGTTLSVGRTLACHRRSGWQRRLGNTSLGAAPENGRRVGPGLDTRPSCGSGSRERAWGRVSSTAEASEFTGRRPLQTEGASPGGTGTRITDVRAEVGSLSRGHPTCSGPRVLPLGLSSFLPPLVAAKRVLVKTLKSSSHKFPPKGLRLVGKELW